MEHHKFKIEKTAHVFTHGEPSSATEYFWFVAHGYGQLASRIIRKFEGFDAATHLVVAPEGLNRFYWNFKTHEVGASWMTRQDRTDEIADYAAYLTTVFDRFRGQISPTARVILFGFSQGCATQMRWILRGQPKFDALVFWGGVLPEDIDYQPFTKYLTDRKKFIFVCGDADEFINSDGIEWHLNFAKAQNIALDYVAFSGKHEILTPVLESVFQDYLAHPKTDLTIKLT